MNKLMLVLCVAALGTAFGGQAPAKPGQKAPQPKTMPADFPAMKAALSMLDLSDAENAKALELGQKYEEQLAVELAKARAAVNERLLADVREAVSGEHRKQLDALLAAMGRRDEAVGKANEKFGAKVKETGLDDLRVVPGQIKNEQQLIERFLTGDPELRQKMQDAKAKSNKSKNASLAALAAPNVGNDKAALKVQAEAKDKIIKEAETQYLSEIRNLLTEAQRNALGQVMTAQREWQQAVDAATKAYNEELSAALGLDKKKSNERKPK